jgi:hypothetical protein
MPFARNHNLPQVFMQNLCLSLGLDKLFKIKPRLQGLLIQTFRVMYEKRDAYDVNDESMSRRQLFFSHVVQAVVEGGVSGGGFRAELASAEFQEDTELPPNPLHNLIPGTLIRLTDVYVRTRKDFRDRCIDKERLVLRPGDDVPMTDMDVDEDDDHEMGGQIQNGSLAVVEDNGSEDEDDLFVREKLEYNPTQHSKKDNLLVSLVDQWIDWVEEQKGNAINPSLLSALEMF